MSSYKIGKITRPANGSGSKAVTLTAAVTKGTVSGTKTFNMMVIEMGLSDAQSVTRAIESIALSGLDSITGNLVLPSSGENGTTISWFSDKPTIISSLGVVNRPNNGSGDITVTLSAKVKKGTAEEFKEFECTVKEWTDIEEIQAAYDALTWDTIKGGNNTVDSVTFNLVLPTVGARNAVIAWTPSNAAVISASGIVSRPDYTEGDITLSLTATITVGEQTMVKQFVAIKVLKLTQTNVEAVLAAKNALTETDILSGNASLSTIINNLTLPKKSDDPTAASVSISWSHKKNGTEIPSTFLTITDISDTQSLATITRPDNTQTNEVISLTATIASVSLSGSSSTETKVFVITIPKEA